MIKEAENIILNKEYFELTKEELAAVSELVQNAEEYDEMKWFLLSSQEVLAGDKISPSPELRSKVMAHLQQDEGNRKFWLNGVIPILLPEDKKFFQKPAFHVGLAALLVLGIFIFSPEAIKDDSVALNDRGGADKEFGVVDEHLVADEDVVENEEALAVELTVAANEEAEPMEGPVVEEVAEDDEIVSPMYDGYYEGDLTEDDLEKIERISTETSKNFDANTVAAGSVNKLTSTSNNNGGNVFPENVDYEAEDELLTVEQKLDKSGTGNLAKGQKDKSKGDKRKDRFAKKSEVNQKADVIIVNDDEIVVGFNQSSADSLDLKFNYKVEVAEKELLDIKLNENSEIKPYRFHVNETKELKKLFTVFK